MAIYCCDKLSKGKLKFEIDWENERLRLLEDFPESKGPGASFSHEWVNFDTINASIKQIGHGGKFSLCFKSDSSCNKTMLSAILNNFGCIDNEYNYIRDISSSLKDEVSKFIT